MGSPVAIAPEMPGEGLTTRVLHSFDEAEGFRDGWNKLVLSSGVDIYQTYEWCRVWWRHYGKRRKLHVICYYCSDELVGLIPAFVEILWLGPARIRVAKLIGSDFSLQFCNLPVMPNVLDEAVARTLQHFLGDQRCDIFIAGPLAGPSARMDRIIAAGRNQDHLVATAESFGTSDSMRFDLPETYEQYQSEIGSRHRGNHNRSVKQFAKCHQVVADVVSEPAAVLREFDQFKAIHEAQWTAEGKLGHFGDWPKAVQFNRDLVESLGNQGMVRFFRIIADGRVASSQFCFLFGGTNYWRLPGRDCRPEWEKLSLGKMGLVQMIEASIAEGVTAVEGGRGHYDYKLQLGARKWPLRTLQFMRRGPGVALRVCTFRMLASILNLIYYKILFCRLAPKLPIFQRSLWSVWIRSTW